MNLLPKSKDEFAQKEYWDTFFRKRGDKAFEWYGEYPELCGHLHRYIKAKDNILIVGCGNSTLGNDLCDVGFKKIISIDISQVVIRQMINLNEKQRPSLKFIQMDALDMKFEDKKFSAILDKGTLDALMIDDKTDTLVKINKYFEEIFRVLKDGGKYICISLLQEHILQKILEYFPMKNWAIKMIRCHEAENKSTEQNENAFPIFMIICSKNKALSPMFLEVSLGTNENFIKYTSTEEVITIIKEIQRAAFVCSHLRHGSRIDQEQISFDLFENENSKPRFTVYIVDVKHDKKNSPYAAFIVPQGREAEWLFSTTDGRIQLTKMTNHNRLVIITMHRDQKYGSLDDVKNELNEVVKNFAPSHITQKIPFLSVGSDVGNRVVRHKGKSKYSGDYVVEDVEIETGVKYRRLYYLQSQLVIQSEAQLKTVKSRRGHPKDVVNHLYLTCAHHLHMSISAYSSCGKSDNPSLIVVGLGGGGLCMFLRKFLPKAFIKGVDIDGDMLKIASDWFGFNQDEKLTVDIIDGIKFLKEHAKKDNKWDAILFDVDSKDCTIGMSCPPKQFLEDEVLTNVNQVLNNNGVFVLNVVLRDSTLRNSIIKTLKSHFKSLTSYKLEEDLNEIIVCFKQRISKDDLTLKFKNSCKQMNNFMKGNGLPKKQFLEWNEFMDVLKIEND